MSEDGTASTDRALMPLLTLGAALGALMVSVSVAGLVFRLDRLSLVASAALAGVAGLATARIAGRPVGWRVPHLRFLVPLVPILGLAALVPPHTWDELAYSVALPRDFALAGRFFYKADFGPPSAFPGNYEALTTAAWLLSGSATAVKLLNVALAIGTAVLASTLFVQLGGAQVWSALPALLVLTAPALTNYVPVAKNDVANAFYQCLAAAACVRYLERPRPWVLALAGAMLGVALGTKYSSLQVALCLVASLVLALTRVPLAPAVRFRHLALFALCAGAAAAPWYVRNLVEFGNPVFPFWNGALGARNGFGPAQAELMAEMTGGLENFSPSPAAWRGFVEKFGDQFGYLPLLLSIPGVFAAARLERSSRLVFLAGLMLSLWLVTFFLGFWEPRYVLILLVLGSVFAVLLLQALLRAALASRGALDALPRLATGAAVLACLAGIVDQALAHLPEVRLWRVLPPAQFQAVEMPYGNVAAWINMHLRDGEKIGVGVNLQPFLLIDRPTFHIHPVSEKGNLQLQETPDEFLEAFRSLGLTALAIRRWNPEENGLLPAKTPNLRAFLGRLYRAIDALEGRHDLKIIGQVEDVTFYRIALRP